MAWLLESPELNQRIQFQSMVQNFGDELLSFVVLLLSFIGAIQVFTIVT